MRFLLSLFKDKRGATAIEYGLIVALIFLAIVTAVRNVALTTTNMWNNVSNEMSGS